jgi:hypothetical protein
MDLIYPFGEPLWRPPEQQSRGIPSRLLSLDESPRRGVRLATGGSLTGYVPVWWSEDQPGVIEWADRCYQNPV